MLQGWVRTKLVENSALYAIRDRTLVTYSFFFSLFLFSSIAGLYQPSSSLADFYFGAVDDWD
jgi:hypothetical protein